MRKVFVLLLASLIVMLTMSLMFTNVALAAYTSICEVIGIEIKGTYTLESLDVTTCEGLAHCYWDLQANVCRCEEWETLGPCNYGGCIGRCDAGCAGVLGSSIQRFTQECFNHDLCRRYTGEQLGDCSDEFWAAAHGWSSAPNCANDASVDVEHVSSGSGCDTEVPVKFKVKNTGNFYDRYNLAATCSPWSCDAPSSVGPIAASCWEFVTVDVSVSEGDECTGSVKLTATSQCNPDVSDFAEGSFTLCKCCPEGSPNEGTCYTPKPDEGCCEYDGKCKDLTDEGVCSICYGGTWHSGWWCEEGECVPEASTLVLFATGLLCLAGYVGLKRRKTK